MRSFIAGISFIMRSQVFKPSKVQARELRLRINGEDVDILVYSSGARKSKGTILVVHGMAALANRDPRMAAVCKAFAACGYTVVSPFYSDIAAFAISFKTVSGIAGTITALSHDRALCPTGRVSLFAPSFSGGMAIIAAALPEVSGIVDSICVVGSYSNVTSAIRYLLGRQDIDDYGRLIILHNFIGHVPGLAGKISGVLRTAILDNGLKRGAPLLPRHLERLNEEERIVFDRLIADPEFRMVQWDTIVKNSGKVKRLLRELSVVGKLKGLKASVALIHGAGDNVIPPEESQLLKESLAEHRVRSRLLITPLISHGDVSLGADALKEAFRLARVFGFFFKYASGTKTAA
ncbi:MAG: alpha/beta hydrolase [Spirochaetes bacterium]|nr:MAG: alpha/beta hydrolase [Spirochaetota bacterium]